jgi:hypothetical protein
MFICRCKFVSPSGTQLSIPAAMVNCERCELVISEVQNHITLERVDVSDNHFDDFSGDLMFCCVQFVVCTQCARTHGHIDLSNLLRSEC